MAADTEPIEILLHLPLLSEDKVRAGRGTRGQAQPSPVVAPPAASPAAVTGPSTIGPAAAMASGTHMAAAVHVAGGDASLGQQSGQQR